jgi:hypothetical protein
VVIRFALLALVLFGLIFYWWLRTANRLFLLEVSRGKVKFRHGRIPPSLLRELADVFAGTKAQGNLACVREGDTARLVPHGDFDEGTLQRARNVLGRYPLARIRAGASP